MSSDNGGFWGALASVIFSGLTIYRIAATILIAAFIGSRTIDYLFTNGWLKSETLPALWVPWIVILCLSVLIAELLRISFIGIRGYTSARSDERRVSKAIRLLHTNEKAVLRCFVDCQARMMHTRDLQMLMAAPPGNLTPDETWLAAQWLRDNKFVDGPHPDNDYPSSQWWVEPLVWRVLWSKPSRVQSMAPSRQNIAI